MGWFEGTFMFITQDWDMISKIRARQSTRLYELYMATAAQTHGAQSRDREVFLEKPSYHNRVSLYTVYVQFGFAELLSFYNRN